MQIDILVLEKLATGFENKILFGLGRHLWNALGVVGVVGIAVGGLMLATSFETEVLTYADWMKKEKGENDPRVREVIGQAPVVERWRQVCENDSFYCDFYHEKATRLQGFEGNMKKQYIAYSEPLAQRNTSAKLRRAASPIFIGGGIGMVAVASVISAILASGRNPRKE